MAFSLRLTPALDQRARARADELGLSMNALVSVAVDLYLRVGQQIEERAASGESVLQPAGQIEPALPAPKKPPSPLPVIHGLLDGKYTVEQVDAAVQRQKRMQKLSNLDREIVKWIAKGGLERDLRARHGK